MNRFINCDELFVINQRFPKKKYTAKSKQLLNLSCKVWYALIISIPVSRKREVIA